MKKTLIIIIITVLTILTIYFPSQYTAIAAITGVCSNCHTMHNSQNGTSMNFDGSDIENELLLRSDCLGCHAMGIAQNIDPVTGTPQVSHTAAIDLAAGNFAYITGAKSRVTADQNTAGHNVTVLGAAYNETVLTIPPGGQHPGVDVKDNFRCAGKYGCHGIRLDDSKSSLQQLKGAHHSNIDGKCDIADQNYNSYRFLLGVKGLENTTDRWLNKDGNSHNEYFGANTPMSGAGCGECHRPRDMAVVPANNTISGFCGTCHGVFHWLDDTFWGGGGIGGNTSSPFIRHPTDVILPNSGEYSAYTAYSTEAPIARTTVFDVPSNTVSPGTDVVMCLSCHAAHATPYADILRWDYSDMIAGDSSKSGGCFT